MSDVEMFALGFVVGSVVAGVVFHILLRRLDRKIDALAEPRRDVFKGLVMYGVELDRYTHDPDELNAMADAFVADLLEGVHENVPTSN